MSRIISSLKDDNSNLFELLEPFFVAIDNVKERLNLKGKSIAQANQDQVSWQVFYDEQRIELNSLVKHFQIKLEAEKGRLWKIYTEKHSRELNNHDKNHYINSNETYIVYKQLLLEVQEIYDKYAAICDAYKTRGFALRNLTELYVNSLQDVIL